MSGIDYFLFDGREKPAARLNLTATATKKCDSPKRCVSAQLNQRELMSSIPGSDIRILNPEAKTGRIRTVLFDFDGTISILRQGWQGIMEQVMLESICAGSRPTTLVRDTVRDYIEESTGVQTIVQMEKLVEMVHRFGRVPRQEIGDAGHYKQIFNNRLLEPVNRRIAQLSEGTRSAESFMVAGAADFCRELAGRGLTLMLASGTDVENVRHEAAVLGVDSLFKGGIYGATGSMATYSKAKLIAELMEQHHFTGPELLVVGDGPVEIALAREHNALSVGVASDEVSGQGWNEDKISRLIGAGCDLLVSDFRQRGILIRHLMQMQQSPSAT